MGSKTLLALALTVGAASVNGISKALGCPEGFVPWPESGKVSCQAYGNAVKDSTAFLMANLPPFDVDNVVTLFGEPGGVDGLNLGIASVAVNTSLDTRMDPELPWAASIPQDIFNDYVLPYANLNEARTNARVLLKPIMKKVVQNVNASTLDDVISAVNGYTNGNYSLWNAITSSKILFKSGSTPLVYDTMSIIAFGYASCTGISIMFVDALRSVGVPARVVGTPAWHNVTANGNHNWVEVWRGEKIGWSFIEGHPAGGGETLDNPCNKWFCNPAHFPTPNDTPVFAARFNQSTGVVYPMAWDPENRDIAGVDRTDYYASTCSKC